MPVGTQELRKSIISSLAEVVYASSHKIQSQAVGPHGDRAIFVHCIYLHVGNVYPVDVRTLLLAQALTGPRAELASNPPTADESIKSLLNLPAPFLRTSLTQLLIARQTARLRQPADSPDSIRFISTQTIGPTSQLNT